MQRHLRKLVGPTLVLSGFVLLALLGAGASRAHEADEAAVLEGAAQEPADEPGEPGDAEPAMDEAGDEEAQPPARGKPKAGAAEEAEEPVVPDDPAVLAVLESHPKTAAELLRAVDILVDLGQAAKAKPYVDELIKRKMDVTAKAALAAQFHSAKLLKLARNAELAPVLGPFVDELFKSAQDFRRDPQRLAGWAKQLSDPDESLRAQAMLQLLHAREAAVAPLVSILADPARGEEHRMAQAALVELGDAAIAPLLGVLESPDEQLKTRVVEVLGRLQAQEALAQLMGPLVSPAATSQLRAAASQALSRIHGRVPSATDALRLLESAARSALDASCQEVDDVAAPSEVWHWNAKQKQSLPLQYDASGASLATAVRLAHDLYRVDPSHAGRRRLYLEVLLQAARFRAGLDKPLPTGAGTARDVAAKQGADVIEDVLADAMARGYIPAATAAAEILGDIGDAGLLARGGSAESTLARAAGHADRRLRFAATGSIMKFKPTEPFAGSSHVVDGLGFFASSYGVPRVLVVHPRSDEAQKLAGLAAGLGYDADIATNGRKAFELATNSPDYEFILIHSAVDRPRVDELVAQLRRDRRTALLPVGLIAPLDDLDRVERFALGAPRTEAFLQPQNDAEMKLFSERVLARGGRLRVSAEERKAQAIAALDWLATMGRQAARVFDVRRQEASVLQVLYVPELSASAATVLGHLGTGKGQRSLLELADLSSQPLAARQAAVAAFAQSVRNHGIMLTRQEILEQYALYNANAGRDADTSVVLSAILDAIENKGDSIGSEP